MNIRRTRRAPTGKILPAALFYLRPPAERSGGKSVTLLTALAAAAGLCFQTLFPSPVFAAFADLGAGARGPGMGNAMAPVADGVDAAHYNPAGLGVMSRPQFTAAYTQLFSGLTDGSKMGSSFFGYALPVNEGRNGTFAGALNSFSLDGALYTENTLYLSYGRLAYTRSGGDELYLGTTLKYLSSSFGSFTESGNSTNGIARTGQADPLLSGNSSHRAFDADLGALYKFKTHYQLGLQVAHLTSPNMAFGSGDSDPLPLDIKLGFNYKSLISNLVVQAETKKAPGGSADKLITVAAERWFPKDFIGEFGLRGALGIGSREYKQLSLGLSYRSRRVQVDYGFALPLAGITDTSGSHRMAITFLFGKPSEQEETLEMLMATLRNSGKVTMTEAPVKLELSKTERTIAENMAGTEEAIKAGRYRDAAVLAAAVIELDPEAKAAWQNLGIAYLGMEKYRSSLYAWDRALQLEKGSALRQAIKGYIQSIKRLERAATAPTPAKTPRAAQKSAMSPQEIEDLMNRGVNYYVNWEYGKAREIFERVLKEDPSNVEAQKALRRLKDEK